MSEYPKPINQLIESFMYLPGIGPKTAERLAFHVLSMPEHKVKQITDSLKAAKTEIMRCSKCNNLTDQDPCYICRDETRNKQLLCIVQEAKDLLALEKTKEFKGQYHVLCGAISPMEGVGPDELNIKDLLHRIKTDQVTEIILATNPTVEGEATAMYISKIAKPLDIKVTRLAYGLPMGGDLEYADEVTLQRAIEGRREL